MSANEVIDKKGLKSATGAIGKKIATQAQRHGEEKKAFPLVCVAKAFMTEGDKPSS